MRAGKKSEKTPKASPASQGSGLEPPDPKRCQVDRPNGYSFMTLGGIPGHVRCWNIPAFIATEVQAKNGVRGQMAICAECLPKLFKQLGPQYATLECIPEHLRVAEGATKR